MFISRRHACRPLATTWSCRKQGFVQRHASTYARHRLAVWDENAEKLRSEAAERTGIKVMVDGAERLFEGQAGVMRPLEIIQEMGLNADSHLLAIVDREHAWDLSRPLESNCSLELVPADSSTTLAQHTVWHSGAHLLGWAMEHKFGDAVFLCDGPAIKNGGFFYDSLIRAREADTHDDVQGPVEKRISNLLRSEGDAIYNVTMQDTRDLAAQMKSFAKKKARFQRLVVPRTIAEHMFIHNPFKLHFLSRIPPDAPVTLYRCGDFIDLCRGPHVPHTGYLRPHRLTRTAGAQWTVTNNAEQPLSRVYGIAFTQPEALARWETAQEEAARRDHRVVGKQQGLFIMNPLAPGSPFMLPHGTRITQKLLDFLRAEYRRFGYAEVVTPLLFNKDVWVTSGHWENYKDDMFVVHTGSSTSTNINTTAATTTPTITSENSNPSPPSTLLECDSHASCCGGTHDEPADADIHGLKPMNCPGHCLVYASSAKSYRDLPIRLAEFSPLHRNEASGALTGLTRVRKFHQDDAHIFCTPDQLQSEIAATLHFIDRVYTIFGFPAYELALSTRPETKFVGEVQQWEDAETQLRKALDGTGRAWTLNPGDGAFYGPKIDILLTDALGRQHQTATVQLDFQLPKRFGLKYQHQDGSQRTPVIVHRAVLGSLERMLAILIEHYAGRWPFWLSPRQAVVVPVANEYTAYAESIAAQLSGRGLPANPLSPSAPLSTTHTTETRRLPPPPPPNIFWHVDVDATDHSLPKRIRDAQAAQYNFMLVVGENERKAGGVAVRARDGSDKGFMTVPQLREFFNNLDQEFK
ncbi:threonine---tRNA ligase [Powellomyces hirtus]|uniref:threonine--tRNA ligase n=1 Tax=Powellomyces hirtus TaxID=109895 RepID=A0A507E932_9FUNG|nr:threonine---tRNA ligase [Powellomyces hirtus]